MMGMLNIRATFDQDIPTASATGGWSSSWSDLATSVLGSLQPQEVDRTVESGRPSQVVTHKFYTAYDARTELVLKALHSKTAGKDIRMTYEDDSGFRVFDVIGGYDTASKKRLVVIELTEKPAESKRN